MAYTQIEKLNEKPAQKSMMRLYTLTTLNRKMQLKQLQVLDTITKRLEVCGITRPVLLKGIGVSQNYIDPGVRQCGDIDLYVGCEHFEEAIEQIKTWSESKIEYNALSRKDYHFEFDGITIELHRIAITCKNITKNRSEFEKWCSEQLEGDDVRCEEIEGIKVYLPPHNFDAIYIFQHAWDHFCTSGIAFRQICDWSRFMATQHDKLDGQKIAERLDYFGLTSPWGFFTALAVSYLGLDASKTIAYNPAKNWHTDKVAKRVWEGGNFGFYSGKYAGTNKNIFTREFVNFIAIFRSASFLHSIDRRYARKYFGCAILHLITTKSRRIYYTITRKK